MAAVQVFLRFFCGCFHGMWFTVCRIGIKEMIGKFGLCFLLWDNHVLARNLCWEIGNIFGYLRVMRNAIKTPVENWKQ